jgi:hypothetical protein
MSVSAINSAIAQTYPSAGRGTSGTSGAAATSGSAAAAPSADAPTSSTIVTLSPGAQALAALPTPTVSSSGVISEQISLASLGISPSDVANSTPKQLFELFRQQTQAINSGAALSQTDFEKLVTQFGGTKAQADQLFQAFDTNSNGSVSNEEFLTGLANASKDGGSAVAQSLFGLMDTNGSRSVSASEFSTFETTFIKAEKVET